MRRWSSVGARLVALLAFVATLLFGAVAFAQHAAPSASAAAPHVAEEVASDSPRASMRRFYDLCAAGEYQEASQYLDVAEPAKLDTALLARHLKVVLDRELTIKIDDLSPRSLGATNDKLPPGVEEIGQIRGDPVRLVRRQATDGPRWIFSRATVEHVEAWYGRLKNAWLLDYLPERLLALGWHELAWWQWIALPSFFLAAWAFARGGGALVRRSFVPKTSRLSPILTRVGGSVRLVFALVALEAYLPYAELNTPAQSFVERGLHAGFLVAFFGFVLGAIDLAGDRFLDSDRARENSAARSVVPLAAKASKIAVIIIAVIAALSELGYQVTSLVAGLGIGGIALALAAQKTVENLFGSVSIGVDQPFRVGDFVKVDDLRGTVESIGLRSTRIRTLDRTLVTIPNGKLADQRIESFAERDRLHFTATIAIALDAKAAQVRAIGEKIEARLRDEKTLHVPSLLVKVAKIADTGIEIAIDAFFVTTDTELASIRQELLLAFLEIVEGEGARLAVPRRVHEVERAAARPDFGGEKTTAAT